MKFNKRIMDLDDNQEFYLRPLLILNDKYTEIRW